MKVAKFKIVLCQYDIRINCLWYKFFDVLIIAGEELLATSPTHKY
jgi:hypothetical protein